MCKDDGHFPSGDRANHEPSPDGLGHSVSVPSVGDWAAYRGSDYYPFRADIRQIAKVTPRLVEFEGAAHPRHANLLDLFAAFPTKEQAEKFRDGLAGVHGEYERRRRAAEDERSKRITDARESAAKQVANLIAQAMSVQQDQDAEQLEAKPASAVATPCAQTTTGAA